MLYLDLFSSAWNKDALCVLDCWHILVQVSHDIHHLIYLVFILEEDTKWYLQELQS